jgi:hypothetical protein
MKICTSYDYPPIPVRSADWCAWVDGTEEDALCGRGETRPQRTTLKEFWP